MASYKICFLNFCYQKPVAWNENGGVGLHFASDEGVFLNFWWKRVREARDKKRPVPWNSCVFARGLEQGVAPQCSDTVGWDF